MDIEPIPVNLAKLEARLGWMRATDTIGRQIGSEERLEFSLAEQVNLPNSFVRQQRRRDLSKKLNERIKERRSEGIKVAIKQAAETKQDLAHRFQLRNWELSAETLRELKDHIEQCTSAEEVFQEVTHTFEDPTLADEAYEYLLQTTEGEVQQYVQQAKDSLQAEHQREIIAGRNIDSAAKSFYEQGFGFSPSQLRDLYRRTTEQFQTHNQLFTALSSEYTFAQMELAVAFLLKAFGYDLKAKGPSIQREELMRLLTETKNLQSILWIYLFFKGRMHMLKKLYEQYEHECPEHITFEFLAQQYIQLVEERYPSIMKLLQQLNPYAKDDIEKVLLLMQFRDASRQLSSRLYHSVKHRQDLILVITETLDRLEKTIEEAMEDNTP